MSDIAKLTCLISDAREAVAKGNTMQVGALIERALKQAVALRQAEKRGAPADPATEGAIRKKLTTSFNAHVSSAFHPLQFGLAEFTLESAVAKIGLRGAVEGTHFAEIAATLTDALQERAALRLTLTIERVE